MKLKLNRGTTSKILRMFIQDSSSTTGAGLTGLTNASSGLTAYYIREGDATPTQIALVAGTVGTWSSGGFKEIDSGNMPGWYELGVPNAVLASGNSTGVHLKGATNMAPLPIEIELDAVNYQDAVAFGLGRLDAAVSSVAAAVWGVAARTLTASLDPTAQQVADAVMDSEQVEAGLTFRQWLRLTGAVLLGKAAGGPLTTVFRAAFSDAKVRVTTVDDSSGNRSNITYDAS